MYFSSSNTWYVSVLMSALLMYVSSCLIVVAIPLKDVKRHSCVCHLCILFDKVSILTFCHFGKGVYLYVE